MTVGNFTPNCRDGNRGVLLGLLPAACVRAGAASAYAQQGRHRLDDDGIRARAADDDPRPRPVLRRPGAHQEHAVDADAGVLLRLHRRASSGCCTATAWPSPKAASSTPTSAASRKAFLAGVTPESMVETFTDGVVIPEYVYICFQMTFACITPALIVGAMAERMKFSAIVLFIPLWVTIVYFPIAHMVWYWAGPAAMIGAGKAVAAATRRCQGRRRSRHGDRDRPTPVSPSSGARSTSPAARWCTSTPASPVWLPP